MKKSFNDFIDKMIEMYKNKLPREEYMKKRKEWNDKREQIERIQREVNEKERILKEEREIFNHDIEITKNQKNEILTKGKQMNETDKLEKHFLQVIHLQI